MILIYKLKNNESHNDYPFTKRTKRGNTFDHINYIRSVKSSNVISVNSQFVF